MIAFSDAMHDALLYWVPAADAAFSNILASAQKEA